MAKWIPLKMDETRRVDDPCPCCGGIASMRCISLVVTLQCIVCGLKVERGIVNERTQIVCEKECLRVWKRRAEPPVPKMPKFKVKLPPWAKYVAQDYKGGWHCYDRQPQPDLGYNGWSAASRSLYLQTVGKQNPVWWKTLYRVRSDA